MADQEKLDRVRFRPLKQFLAAIVSSQGSFILGTVLAWSSPALPDLYASELGPLSGNTMSWIASLSILGALLSAIPGGYAVEKIGRRKTIMLSCLPLFVGWLQIIFADSVRMIYFGRLIIGIFAGVFSMAVPVYIGECSQDKYRGTLGSFFTLQLVTGILLTYILGSFTSWRILSVILAGFPPLLFIGMYFMPESPIYLVSIEKDKEAVEALRWLRGDTELEQIEAELKLIKIRTENCGDDEKKIKLKDWFAGPTLKPLIISIIIMILNQWSGIGIAIIYTVQIFKSAGSTLSPHVSTIIVGIAQVFGVALSSFLIDRLGRRILLITSCLTMVLCHIPMGIFYYVKEHNYKGLSDESLGPLALIPLISLVAFMVLFSIGLGPIPWILPGELMPPNFRAMTAAIATTFNWLAGFILSKIFEDISAAFGIYSCYWIFAGICFSGALFVYFVLPETKQKSYEEIALHFNSQSISSRL